MVKILLTCLVLTLVWRDVVGFPCLPDESKKKFDANRKAITDIKSVLTSRTKQLEKDLTSRTKQLEKDLTSRIQLLEKDLTNRLMKVDSGMGALVTDFKKRQWQKYNGHCYFYGTEKVDWFTGERRCKEIGGHLAKIDDTAENKWLYDSRPINRYYWMGLSDLKEGEYRWTYDQTLTKLTPWYSGYGNKGTKNNCGLLHYKYTWLDYPCASKYRYVCESHFCY